MKNIGKKSIEKAYRLFETGDVDKIELAQQTIYNKYTATCSTAYMILPDKYAP